MTTPAGTILPREQTTEAALSWANQQSYAFASIALTNYCALRNLSWSSAPMYNCVTFEDLS